jgi:hypothetical protein
MPPLKEDELWPTWDSEMAAMIHSETLSPLDLIVLTAAVDNRLEIMKLQQANGKTAKQTRLS